MNLVYNVYRYDRCNLTSLCTRGGGVLIVVRKDLCSSSISISNLSVEQVYVRCTIGSKYFVIGGVYIPPNSLPISITFIPRPLNLLSKNFLFTSSLFVVIIIHLKLYGTMITMVLLIHTLLVHVRHVSLERLCIIVFFKIIKI